MQNLTPKFSDGINLTCGMSGSHPFIFTLVPVVYGFNFVIGVVGNGLVVAVIYRYMKLKTVANVFVLNLAISDLTFLITLPMWATFTATGYYWPFGSFLCKASAGLVIFNLYTSIFFLTALSVDRYLAIVHPPAHRADAGRAQHQQREHINNENTVCGTLHPKDAVKRQRLLLAISLMKSLLGFLAPFLVLITCYCLIGRALLGARRIQKSARSRDDEVLRMLAAAVLAFFLCWVPHQVFHFLQMLYQLKVLVDCPILEVIDTAMPFTICVAYFNSCVNPIVYGFVGRNFRRNMLRLLCCGRGPGGRGTPGGAHPSISSKMSALSYRASEALSLTAKGKSSSSTDVK
ncbi:hypothetical protein NHX12_026470 [Muraenolepis orangiensis]|uniref:Type-1 angiotensin II receptor n=1 Tax=Muraenolepis orangiensis TaxID=630683 RepID=A0A9Q0IQA9_9TELE|nr:hypothetical protein NHX12_026470 [Muraenolepis orangiensis]